MPHSYIPNHSIAAHHRKYKTTTPDCPLPLQTANSPLLFLAGYVGMQLVPKTTRNPHQIGGVVLRLGAWSGAGRVWGRAAGEEGQTAGPVLVPLPGSLRGLDTSVRQKQTSRRAPAQTGVPWQRFGAEVLGTQRRTHRQVSSMCELLRTCVCVEGKNRNTVFFCYCVHSNRLHKHSHLMLLHEGVLPLLHKSLIYMSVV